MNWENIDFSFEDEKDNSSSQNRISTQEMSTEDEDEQAVQLRKFQDPAFDIDRQACIHLINTFGELLTYGHLQEIVNTLLTEDSQCFLFNFLDNSTVLYSVGNKEFVGLYRGARIIARTVRETCVDLAKNAVFQTCECKILNAEDSIVDQVTYEAFTIQGAKILRYRAVFASKTAAHGFQDPFELTRKDIMLAKAKELSYALADQPDIEKIVSLLQENAEYKIWDWDGQKCHTFHRDELVEGFKSLEENLAIKCVVPYGVYSENQYIIGTYVYHLEAKTNEVGKEFVWLSTCVCSFDKDNNIVRVSQQGELYPKDEVSIPFEAFSRQKLEQKSKDFLKDLKSGEDLFYSAEVDFSCAITRFGPPHNPHIGHFQGMKQIEKLQECVCKGPSRFEWAKVVDVFVDSQHPSYDIAIAFTCGQAIIDSEGYKYQGKRINFFTMNRYAFENGKLARMYHFFCEVPEVIPSPFDDPEFEGINIVSRKTDN